MEALPQPPFDRLGERLYEIAVELERSGDVDGAASLRRVVAEWSREQEVWNARLRELLGVHHEINNALVGVRGNTQLMLMNPAGQAPGVRERLEVVLRESGRIQEAAARIRELKAVLGRSVHRPNAA